MFFFKTDNRLYAFIIVYSQTFSYIVIYKVCLAACGSGRPLNFTEYLPIWFSRLIKLANHILLNSPYNLLTIHIVDLEKGNWSWWEASTRIVISVRGASRLDLWKLQFKRSIELGHLHILWRTIIWSWFKFHIYSTSVWLKVILVKRGRRNKGVEYDIKNI